LAALAALAIKKKRDVARRWCRRRGMGSPQDPRARRREKKRRARKNARYDVKKAAAAAASPAKKKAAAPVAKSAK
jgi:hypothetical protein